MISIEKEIAMILNLDETLERLTIKWTQVMQRSSADIDIGVYRRKEKSRDKELGRRR